MRVKRKIKSLISHILHPKFYMSGKIHKECYIGYSLKCNKPKYVEIGKNVRIGDNCRISIYDYFFGNKYDPLLLIGDNCYIGNNFSILCANHIYLGKNVLVASNVIITSENHGMDPEMTVEYMHQPLVTKPVKIGNGVWIGEKVIILPGVVIGEKSIIAAGSVVAHNVDSYTIVAGNPAKPIKKYNFSNKKWEKVKL